jgi:hypothetical protein
MKVRWMIKISKKILAITVFLSVLLGYSCCTALLPTAHAQVINETTDSQKAIDFLSNVVGINMNACATNLTSYTTVATPISSLTQDNVIFNLTSYHNTMKARFTFINGNLNLLYLSNVAASSSINQPTANALVSAQGFLQRYQSYTGNQLYGSLSSMLNNVAPNTNKTETVENVKLQASVLANQTEQSLIWTYVDNNGVPALMKDIVLNYHNGQLESFLDNWQVYTTGGVPTVSSQDAVTAALQAAKNYSYMAENAEGNNVMVSGFKIASVFNVSLSYVNYYETNSEQSIRGGNPYVLYPSWYVGVGFNKVYPGGVTGLNIRVWADSGNVSSVEPIIWAAAENAPSAAPQSGNNSISTVVSQLSAMPTPLLIFALAVVGVVAAYGCITSNSLNGFRGVWRKGLKNRKVIALGLILPLTLLMVVIPSAFALKSDTFVTEAAYSGYPLQLVNDEIAASRKMGSNIDSNYSSAGVAHYYQAFLPDDNYAGMAIANTIQSDESNYNAISVFAYGNGPAPYWDYYDGPEGYLTESEIYYLTPAQKVTFAWQFTCQSAGKAGDYTDGGINQGATIDFGFANAWLGNSSITITSALGFDFPDSSGRCFIGFAGQAPMLSQESFQGYTQLAYIFVEYFYEAATSGYTVHDSLNLASEAVFGVPYWATPLAEGYMAWYPGGEMGGDPIPQGYVFAGFMMVYGDSDIYISPASQENVSAPSISGSSSDNTLQLSISATDSENNNVAYLIDWGDGSPSTLTSFYPSGAPEPFSHYYPYGTYIVTVHAESSSGVWSQPSTYTATIGPPLYQTQVNVYVTLDGYNWYLFETNYINEPAGWNYLNFDNGFYFVEAYNCYDGTLHTTNPDWYNLGTGTTIDVDCYW